MKYGYISKIESAKEFQNYIQLFEQREVALDNIVINTDFDTLLASLVQGDTVIILSYIGVFASLSSYMTTVIELLERGITIESLQQPDVRVNSSNEALIRELNALNRLLRSNSSLKGMTKSITDGKRLGRPHGSSPELRKKVAQVEKLCRESNTTVVAACKLVGCNMKTYYRLKNDIGVSSVKETRKDN